MGIEKEFNDSAWRIIPGWITAAAKGEMDPLQKFLDDGMKVDAQDINGQTALMVAVREGRANVVDFLLQKGADITLSNREGWTALDIAAGHGHAELVEKLIGAGADATRPNDCNACFMSRHNQPWKFGLNLGVTPLMLAAKGGFKRIAQALIDHKADVKAVDKWGCDALMRAAEQGHADTARLLLDNGADANAQDGQGWTALRKAAWAGQTDTVALLLGATDPKKASTSKDPGWGAAPNEKSTFPGLDDALISATGGAGNQEIIRLVLDKGADVNARRNDAGETPLYMAAIRGRADLVRFLLDCGADAAIPNKNGIPAFSVASDAATKAIFEEEAKKKAPPAPPTTPAPAPQPPTP
jgi:uncharacterized protein